VGRNDERLEGKACLGRVVVTGLFGKAQLFGQHVVGAGATLLGASHHVEVRIRPHDDADFGRLLVGSVPVGLRFEVVDERLHAH
jgi:hypothetical protein